jgi:8-oxo-dGTP pyrophosphatase MutT (NUDIX family)
MSLEVAQPAFGTPEPDPLITAAGGVVYRRNGAGQIEILLIKKQGGFWTLPKGRIKEGEDERVAVAREVEEETNITGTVEGLVRQVLYTIQKAGRRRRKAVAYYLMRAEQGQPHPQAKERIVRVRWFVMAAALRRIRRKRIRNVVREARVLLGGAPAPKPEA